MIFNQLNFPGAGGVNYYKNVSTMPGKLRFTRRMVYDALHVVVLLLSILLVVGISVDTFKDIAFYNQPRFLKLQLMVCLFFSSTFSWSFS